MASGVWFLATTIYNNFCLLGSLVASTLDVDGLLDAILGSDGIIVVVLLSGIFPQMKYACTGVGESVSTVIVCAASLLLITATYALNILLTRMPLLISGYMVYAVRFDFIVGRCFFFW